MKQVKCHYTREICHCERICNLVASIAPSNLCKILPIAKYLKAQICYYSIVMADSCCRSLPPPICIFMLPTVIPLEKREEYRTKKINLITLHNLYFIDHVHSSSHLKLVIRPKMQMYLSKYFPCSPSSFL